jgi:hypothetical protein
MLIKNKLVPLLTKNKFMTFLQKYWPTILFVAILVYFFVDAKIKENAYKAEIKKHNEKIDSLNKVIQVDLVIIDSLKKKDTVYIKEIKEIKAETNENIKNVDTMSVSNLQSFYSKRYPESRN